MARAKSYRNCRKTIFGLKCSQHRAFVMPKILSYHRKVDKRSWKKAGKEGLLNFLEQLERKVTRDEYEVIQDWLWEGKGKWYSEKRLHRRLNTSRGIENEPEGPGSDSDSDQSCSTRTGSSEQPPLVECSACLENLHRTAFLRRRLLNYALMILRLAKSASRDTWTRKFQY
jgi:hypothetical protein